MKRPKMLSIRSLSCLDSHLLDGLESCILSFVDVYVVFLLRSAALL